MKAPAPTKFVVESGLTRRLVTATDAREARVIFLRDVPRGNLLSVPYEAVKVFAATPEMVAEFRKGKKAKFDGQLALDLDATLSFATRQAGPKRRAAAK